MFRNKIFTVCVLLSAVLIIGCSSDDDDDPTGPGEGKPPAAMVDTWHFQDVTQNGAAAVLATVLEWQPLTVRAEFAIQANGAYVYQEVNQQGGQLWFESGFVFVDGTEMDINILLDGDGQVDETNPVTFSLAGDVLTITETTPGTTLVFTLVRVPN